MQAIIHSRIMHLVCGLGLVLPSPAVAQGIGFSEWFQPEVEVQSGGSGDAEIMTRNRAFALNDFLDTSENGAADITFIQGQRLLVGPDCDVVLDRRIYDPDATSVSLQIYARTVCVTRAGAGAQPIVLRTPIALVRLTQASAVIEYKAGPDAPTPPGTPSPAPPPSPTPDSPVPTAGEILVGQADPDTESAESGDPGSLTIISESTAGIGEIVVEPVGGGSPVNMKTTGQMITLGANIGQSGLVAADPKTLAKALKGFEIAGVDATDGTFSDIKIDLGALSQSLPSEFTTFDFDRFNPCAFGSFCDRVVVCTEISVFECP